MDFEDWKRELDSEARRKAAKLEREAAHLKYAIRKKDEKISKMRETMLLVCMKCHEKSADCRGCREQWRCEKIREGTGNG